MKTSNAVKKLLLLFILATTFSFAQDVKTTLTYLVHKPSRINKHTPVLIVMHGYGANETDLFQFSKQVGKDFLIFSLQAPQTLKDGGYCWFDIDRSSGVKKCNYQQLELSRAKVISFISNACAAYKADSSQVFLLGFSQGGSMAYDIAIFEPQKIKGIVSLSGLFVEDSKNIKTDWDKVAKVKLFIGHGTSDNLIPFADAQKNVDFFKSKKIENLSFLNYPIGHSIHADEVKDVLDWLEKNKN
jgi:phospholipase/carboxylesterase